MAEPMIIASIWESMAAWFTPTVLFCVTNLIIATIYIASNNQHIHGDPRMAKVSSFLERAGSMKLSSYTTSESQHQYISQFKSANYNFSSTSRLAQSIYSPPCYITPSGSSEPDEHEPSQQPSLFERVRSFIFTSESNANANSAESDQVTNSPGQLGRVPSFIERVKSFKIYSAFGSGPTSAQTGDMGPDPNDNKSETTLVKKKLVGMKKSRSEMRMGDGKDEDVDLRRPATAREPKRDDFDEEVDAKADDFISRFKQQLKLQRLESIVRYNEMVNRRR